LLSFPLRFIMCMPFFLLNSCFPSVFICSFTAVSSVHKLNNNFIVCGLWKECSCRKWWLQVDSLQTKLPRNFLLSNYSRLF
jgi:hypothetical protein